MNEDFKKVDPKERHFSVLPHEVEDKRTVESIRRISEVRERVNKAREDMGKALEELDKLLRELEEKGVEDPEILEVDGSKLN